MVRRIGHCSRNCSASKPERRGTRLQCRKRPQCRKRTHRGQLYSMLLNQSSPPLVRTIGKLIAEKLLVEVHSPEDDLLATGVLDSLSLIELLLNLEQHFGMKIPLDELQIEDVRSVRSIANMVESKRPMRSQPLEVGFQTI